MRRVLATVVLAVLAGSCTKTTPPATAFKVKSRADLIGGKRALGEVGDYKLSNGIVQAVIQDVGTSRGFGAFGGSLIDVDLVRSGAPSAANGPAGNDYFTEMFPAFFLTAIEPSEVKVLNDGSDGQAAVIRVSGRSGHFISLVKSLTDLVDPAGPLDYSCDYILEPGKQYLKIQVSVSNPNAATAQWGLNVPFGFVTLLGEGQRLFVPGQAGFDMRWHLEDTVYKRPATLDAIPGEVTQMWTTQGDGVSYAMAAARPLDGNYMDGKPMYYPDAKSDSMLIPIAYSSFLGSFWAKPPAMLPSKGTYTYAGYLAVGTGDVASVQKVIYDLRDAVPRPNGKEVVLRDTTPYGTLSGLVTELPTNRAVAGTSVVLQDERGRYVSQAVTLANGRWTAAVPPGKYRAYAVDGTRTVVHSEELVAVEEGGSGTINLQVGQSGELQVIVRDERGRALPSKISVEATADDSGGKLPRRFLYDLKVGERFRPTDMIPDSADADSRHYLERVLFAVDGTVGHTLRPGTYKIWASRGIEYDLQSQEVTVTAGKTTTVGFTLTQVAPTPGWLSGDFHVHSLFSPDSSMPLKERVSSYAVEGVDLVVSTDHNYVADLGPTVDGLNLRDWLASSVGLELTSLEMGHFNAFPIQVAAGPIGHGSFRWFFRPPGELFAQLRGLGRDSAKTVVQVNHPRDSVLGYFNAFNFGTYVGGPADPIGSFTLDQAPQANGLPSPYAPENFSLDFDAMEVFNGKRKDIMFNYRVPTEPIPGDEPNLPKCTAGLPTKLQDCMPNPGEVLQRATTVTVNGVQKTVLQPAYPGAIDDWFTLLGQGRRITATGNSDSHSALAEAGLPRTYLQVGSTADGSMRGLDLEAPYKALREGRALVTNGPFIEVAVNDDHGPGDTVVAPDGLLRVRIRVSAAQWIDVKRVVVRRGGKDQGLSPEVLEVIPVTETEKVLRLDTTRVYRNIPDDSFIVIEAFGDNSMYPVFTPHEVPSVQISDAVGVIGGAFGFGSKFGKYKPSQEEFVTPYGFTNPVFITYTNKQMLRAAKRVLPLSSSEPFVPRTLPDLRKLFGAFHADPE